MGSNKWPEGACSIWNTSEPGGGLISTGPGPQKIKRLFTVSTIARLFIIDFKPSRPGTAESGITGAVKRSSA